MFIIFIIINTFIKTKQKLGRLVAYISYNEYNVAFLRGMYLKFKY